MAADDSDTACARALARLQDWQAENVQCEEPCRKRINVLAHSMGNRVLRGAIKRWGDDLLGRGPSLMFRNLLLVAADLENQTLERGHEGESLVACGAQRGGLFLL
jgi:esterase/lipase superfamily enzyme